MRIALLLLLLGLICATQVEAQTAAPLLNVRNYGAICDGGNHPLSSAYATLAAAQAVYPFVTSLAQQIDYAALKKTSNIAFGPDGAEHGASSPTLNSPIYIPQGNCYIGSDIWKISNATGIRITGASPAATQITGLGASVLQFDGLQYSEIANMELSKVGGAAAGATLDIDRVAGNVTVQFDTFPNLFVSGGGAQVGNGSYTACFAGTCYDAIHVCVTSAGGGQCSEMVWINLHTIHADVGYYQYGYNALDNLFEGGDMQDYTSYAIHLIAGSLSVHRMSFENNQGLAQLTNGVCDIRAGAAGVFESLPIIGARSEGFCFYQDAAGDQSALIEGFTQGSLTAWQSAHAYSTNAYTDGVDVSGVHHLFYVTTPGTSGGSQPTWPSATNATVSDGVGGLVWKNYGPYNAISIRSGTFDEASSYVYPTASVVEGNAPIVSGCGTGSPALSANSTKKSGTVTEGSGATGCTLTWNSAYSYVVNPRCTISSPNGAAAPTYAATATALTLTHSSLSGAQYSWVCQW